MAHEFTPNIFAGDGIILSLFQKEDVEPLHKIIHRNKSHLAAWLRAVGNPSTLKEVHQYVKDNQKRSRDALSESFRSHPGFELAIRNDGELVGMIGFQGIHWGNRLTALGYWIIPESEGRGIVTKACKAMVTYAFDTLHLNRIEIQCAEDNPASMGIPERLGFHKEAILAEVERRNEGYVSHYLYRMLRSDWQK